MSEKIRCPICWPLANYDGFAEVERLADRDGYRVACSRCGRYDIDGDLLEDIRDNPNKRFFTRREVLALSWACRKANDAAKRGILFLTYDSWPSVVAGAPIPSGAEYLDSIIKSVAELSEIPGEATPDTHVAALAASLFLPGQTLQKVMMQLQSEGVLTYSTGRGPELVNAALTPEGWKRAGQIARRRNSNTAFVAMWFAPSMNSAYQNAIVPALLQCGYQPPFRVDDSHHDKLIDDAGYTNRIDNRILAEIRKARFVIADVTGARNGVYYEAGFADGLSIPVIWTCRQGNETDMHFDTRQIAHILWTDEEDLRAQLTAKIEAHG